MQSKPNKKILATALALACVAPVAVFADTPNVDVYGTINADFENVKATAAGNAALPAGIGQIGTPGARIAAPSRNRVTSNSSNIGFRGSEVLLPGLKAIFQIESGLNIDSASVPGASVSNGVFASRNSNVGLSSQTYGTVFYGNWDTPYKFTTGLVDPFYATGIASGNAFYGSPGFNVNTTTAGAPIAAAVAGSAGANASFDRRQGNSVQYWSPKLFNFTARLGYSADEGRANETPLAPVANINPLIYSAALQFEYGPFRATYAFEQHRDYFGLVAIGGAVSSLTNRTARDNGNKVTLSYKLNTGLGATTANVTLERLSYNNSDTVAGNLSHFDRDLIYVSVLHKIGDGTIRLGFGDARQGSCNRAGATVCSTNGLDARQYAVGYSYSFSKRTDVYALYTLINNGTFANYQLGNGATLPTGGGARNQGFGLGIRHVF
ncbi:MAG: porin [Burkholderiales bacterium]